MKYMEMRERERKVAVNTCDRQTTICKIVNVFIHHTGKKEYILFLLCLHVSLRHF